MKKQIISIVGPTASGKTALSVALAQRLGGEIVSTDSMQIYRGMDIGTAKPTASEMGDIPHQMIDVVDPSEDFSVARYVEMATPLVDDILRRGKTPILVGGTGLYLDSLLSGRTFAPFVPTAGLRERLEGRYDEEGGDPLHAELAKIDPETAKRLHFNDKKRVVRALEVYHTTGKTLAQHDEETRKIPPRYTPVTIGLTFDDRADMWARIDRRVDEMVSLGLVDEIRTLLDGGLSPDCTAMQAIGYKEFLTAIQTDGDLHAAAEEVKLRSRQYAKRQLTWFRRRADTFWYSWSTPIDFSDCLHASTAFLEEKGLI